ncbi:hypothetical protein HQ545_08390 [Candidatus Woesearchaeota archaeon]|nr:hypothetical protein [Candidatus Woesearchaeota archaeon]
MKQMIILCVAALMLAGCTQVYVEQAKPGIQHEKPDYTPEPNPYPKLTPTKEVYVVVSNYMNRNVHITIYADGKEIFQKLLRWYDSKGYEPDCTTAQCGTQDSAREGFTVRLPMKDVELIIHENTSNRSEKFIIDSYRTDMVDIAFREGVFRVIPFMEVPGAGHQNLLITEETCTAEDGKWQYSNGLYYCFHEYSDAGKTCTCSSQCEGLCKADPRTGTGTCSKDSDIRGCYATIEGYNEGKGLACID